MRELLQYMQHFRRMYQKSFQKLGRELELSQMEIDLLLFLRNNPDRNTARDAVALRGFAKSNVSTGVERLEAKGWLRVEPDPESRRIKRLVLEKSREAALERLARCQEDCFAAIVEDMTTEEREGLRALLERMDANVQRALSRMEQGGEDDV